MKNTKPKLRHYTRGLIAFGFVLLICVAAYTDRRMSLSEPLEVSSNGEYIYTSNNEKEEQVKILGEAAFVDGGRNDEETTASADNVSEYDTYFYAMQVDRQRSRDEAIEMLRTVADSAETLPDVKEDAFREMMAIANNIEIESNVRSMVMAKGFDECMAVINGDKLNVIVKTDGLLTNEVAQITEIAVNETGFSADNIRIVEKKN